MQITKMIRLRYADVGQEDIFGGVVVLEGVDQSKLRDGQHAKVTGVLIAPTSRMSSSVSISILLTSCEVRKPSKKCRNGMRASSVEA